MYLRHISTVYTIDYIVYIYLSTVFICHSNQNKQRESANNMVK